MIRKKTTPKPVDQPPPGFKLRCSFGEYENEILRIAWSPEGHIVASPLADGTIRLWQTDTGKLIQKLKGSVEKRNCLAWSPSGKMIATGSRDTDILLWNVKEGKQIKRLKGHSRNVFCLVWSPDSRILASSSDDLTIRLWDVDSGKQIFKLLGHVARVYSIAWSPNMPLLASGADDMTVRLWNVNTGEPIKMLKGHHNYVYSVAWSPDGRLLASASMDQTVRLWDPQAGHQLTVLEGHTGLIRWLSFSPDGRILASKSSDGTIRFWRHDIGQTVAVLNEPTVGRWPSAFAFHPTAHVLATFGKNNRVVHIWDLDFDVPPSRTPEKQSIQYANAKVVLVGETSTGKTCLARALMGKPFKPQESTHGMKVWNFHSETTKRDNEGQITREIMLWDLAGQVDYQVVHQLFLDETVLGIVMFDPTHPENPFSGIGHWENAFKRVVGKDCPKLLVAGRVDRGHPTASNDDIEFFRQEHGYQKFIATSAKTGEGVEEMREAIRQTIPWDKLPITSSPQLWKQIREYLLKRRAGNDIITQRADLQESFRQKHPGAVFSDAEFDTVIGHAQVQGLMWRFSFGNFVLLKPELLNDYAGAIVRVARKHLEGLGSVPEQDVLNAQIEFEDLERMSDKETERSLLHAVVELFLHRELALRESQQLVFPSKFNRKRPGMPKPQSREVAYRFFGSVEEIYATLVVRLYYCGAFVLKNFWKNAAEFCDSLDNLCGFSLDRFSEGKGMISVFFENDTTTSSKVLFLRFIHEHLHQRALSDSVRRERIYRCPECNEEVENRRAIEFRIRKGLKTIPCQFCGKAIDLLDALESKFANPDLLRQIRAMEDEVATKRGQAVGMTIAESKESIGEYDVFLAHNSADKPQVEAIGEALKRRGLNPWLDKEQIPPGRWFQDVIQEAIREVKSAAIFIGPQGVGRWQVVELRSFISQCVDRRIPVIPVLLPGVTEIPTELIFLNEFSWVKFSKDIDEAVAMENLQWGITDKHPKRRRETLV